MPEGEYTLEGIRGYLRLSDRLATSGMPQPEHFAALRKVGFEVVINLALPTSDNALPNEGELVTSQGMIYVHIPVRFDAPQPADFERFSGVMDVCEGQRVFVHCAANMRVSAFIFLYRLQHGQVSRDQAERDLRRIWEPDEVWRGLINQCLARTELPRLS
jgi:protein tyrosine phosphatase (PTP) superfamily phosphohydrolase (DUF442 family)